MNDMLIEDQNAGAVAVRTADPSEEEYYTPEQIEEMSTEELLLAYKRTGSLEQKWPLVLRYRGLVKRVALQIRGVYSNFAQVDDIISEGVLTLMTSLDKYEPDKGVKFETYVSKRIRGMIIDLARRQDWMPRGIRKRAHEIDEISNALYIEFNRYPTDEEVASRLGVSKAKYLEDLASIAPCNIMSLEALFEDYQTGMADRGIQDANGLDNTPETAMQDAELQKVLADGIRTLRENEQIVLNLYYQKNLNMKKIAQAMDVSEPRVSQIHTRAIQKLRMYMQRYIKSEL